MRRSCGITLLISSLIGACAGAQDVSPAVRFRLFLPPDVPSEKVEIRYVLYGAFGANGNFLNPRPNTAFVEIPLGMDGTPAEEIRAFAWAPGCRIKTFDIKLEGVDVPQDYSCEPLPSVVLTGDIKKLELRKEEAEIQVDYLANWACEFFGFADCMVPQFSVGAAKPDPTGRFEMDLPDFASDPARRGSALSSTFQLVLRELKTKNPIAFLNPEPESMQVPGGGLKPMSVYPDRVMFIAKKWR